MSLQKVTALHAGKLEFIILFTDLSDLSHGFFRTGSFLIPKQLNVDSQNA